MESYSSEVGRIGNELIGSIALIMGLDKAAMLKLHGDLVQALRKNYYPTCGKPGEVLGLCPHSDSTILMQSDDIEGLQIRHDGMWVTVRPIPDALVVNLGDVIEVAMSNIMSFLYFFSFGFKKSLQGSDYIVQCV